MDYYETLGVSRDASETAIKKAYRELCYKTHPDRNSSPDAVLKQQHINEAYETLGDPQKKRQYDMGSQNHFENILGELFRREPFMRQGNTHMNAHMNAHMNPHIQIFEMMHQMGDPISFQFEEVHPTAPILETHVELSFEQAYNGESLPITVVREIIQGMSRTKESEKIYVTIPAGIDSGEIIEVPEKGNQLQRRKGPLKIHIKVKPHEVFERKGLNLCCTHVLTFRESICGFDFTLTLLDGTTLKLKSSAGHIIQNMDEKVIKGKGIHREGGGDLLLKFRVLPPKVLSEEQVSLFANLL
jgi:DnaJ-class molecular chaperone